MRSRSTHSPVSCYAIIVLGLACVTGTVSHADSMIDSILTFIEDNADAEIVEVLRELR